jgi:transcriptional regulator NrdR family protein
MKKPNDNRRDTHIVRSGKIVDTVYISFIRYARVYTQYSDLMDRAQLLAQKYPIIATLLLC